MVTTRPPKTIVKPTALGPGANTDTKLLIYGLFQKGRVLAQDAVVDLRGFQEKLTTLTPIVLCAHVSNWTQLILINETKCLRSWIRLVALKPTLDPVVLAVAICLVEASERNWVKTHPSTVLAETSRADSFTILSRERWVRLHCDKNALSFSHAFLLGATSGKPGASLVLPRAVLSARDGIQRTTPRNTSGLTASGGRVLWRARAPCQHVTRVYVRNDQTASGMQRPMTGRLAGNLESQVQEDERILSRHSRIGV